MYRVEVSVSAGNGKFRTAGGVSGVTKESINRAFSYMLAKKGDLSIARELDVSDLHVEVIDLMNNRVEGEIGLGFFIAAFSALKKAQPVAAMLVLGDLSVQGNIKGLRSLAEPLQLAMDNGAKRADPTGKKAKLSGGDRRRGRARGPDLLWRPQDRCFYGFGFELSFCG